MGRLPLSNIREWCAVEFHRRAFWGLREGDFRENHDTEDKFPRRLVLSVRHGWVWSYRTGLRYPDGNSRRILVRPWPHARRGVLHGNCCIRAARGFLAAQRNGIP